MRALGRILRIWEICLTAGVSFAMGRGRGATQQIPFRGSRNVFPGSFVAIRIRYFLGFERIPSSGYRTEILLDGPNFMADASLMFGQDRDPA